MLVWTEPRYIYALMRNLPQVQRAVRARGCYPGTHSNQSSSSRSEFECTVMETMQHLSQRLDSLAEKVEGSND